jgi:hydrogenase maturation protease
LTGRGDPGRRTVVVGVGNVFRRDDGAGPEVIARLRALQPGDASLSCVTLALSDGEPGRLIDLWEGASLALVIDAVRDSRLPPGHTCQLAADALASVVDGAASSHGISLGDTVELARVLGRLPSRLTVLAVVGRDFGFGVGLTTEVADAVGELAEQVRQMVRLSDRFHMLRICQKRRISSLPASSATPTAVTAAADPSANHFFTGPTSLSPVSCP